MLNQQTIQSPFLGLTIVSTLLLAGPAPANTLDHEWRIVITEIMYNPASKESTGQTEWVEIANLSAEPIEIKDWRLDDEDDQNWGRFSCTIAPGGVVVLVNSDAVTEDDFRAAWDADFGTESAADPTYQVIGVTWASLANSPTETNEILHLLDEHDDIVCEVNYRKADDWPDVSRPDGPSIWLNDLTATDLNKGELWSSSADGSHGARKPVTTPIFSAADIGSPGHVEGLAELIDTGRTADPGATSETQPAQSPTESEPETDPEDS